MPSQPAPPIAPGGVDQRVEDAGNTDGFKEELVVPADQNPIIPSAFPPRKLWIVCIRAG
jgi:hypothetical protein